MTQMRSVVARGMIFTSFAVFIAKASTLLTHWILGNVLSAADFGYFAIVTTAVSVISALQDPGLGRYLIKEQSRLDDLIGIGRSLSLLSGLLGGTILVAVSFVLAHVYRDKSLIGLISLLAIFVPFYSQAILYKSVNAISLRFGRISLIESANSVIYSIVVVSFAIAGAGGYSFVAGLAVSYLLLYVLYLRDARGAITPKPWDKSLALAVIKDLKWIIAGTFAVSFALRGDYMALGAIASKEDLGYYFFGFMLTANIGLLVAHGVNSVLMPSLSSLSQNPARMAHAIDRATGAISFVTGTICVVAVIFLPTVIELLWQGKWERSTAIALAMAISLPLRMLLPIANSVLEASGLWKRRALYSAFDGFTLILSVVVGFRLSGLIGCAIAVSIQRALVGAVVYLACRNSLQRETKLNLLRLIRVSAPFLFSTAPAVLLTYYAPLLSDNPFQLMARLLTLTVCSLAAFSAISWLTNRQAVVECFELLKGLPLRSRGKWR